MNVNEHDINTMNGWRRENTKTLMQGSITRIHNCPKFSAVPNLLKEGRGGVAGGSFLHKPQQQAISKI